MWNVKYFYEFKGLDEVLNKVEILTKGNCRATEITASESPFVLEYPDKNKLDVLQSSGAKIHLISEQIFQFMDLHTDDMKNYLVKFYRDNNLYWLGYLDSELYEEDLSAYPPYPVQFSAADFNILDRLEYRNESDNKYTDIDSLLGHIKRCFDKLGLPFTAICIGCSTTAEGITLSNSETVLHKLYVQSSNFYDEDGEAMSCREVVECILEPFGLMLTQRSGNIYIYDYNTIMAGSRMKSYNFDTLSYMGEVAVNVNLGDLSDIGFSSTDSTLGFEEMINNVEISCSPYVKTPFYKQSVEKGTLKPENQTNEEDFQNYKKYTYNKSIGWNWNEFVLFQSKKRDSTIMGAKIPYKGIPKSRSSVDTPTIIMSVYLKGDYITGADKGYMLNIKLDAYFNSKSDPFDQNEKSDDSERTRMGVIVCKLYLLDNEGNKIKNYRGFSNATGQQSREWLDDIDKGSLILVYSDPNIRDSRVLNKWVTNSNIERPGSIVGFYTNIDDVNYGKGYNVPLPSGISGFLQLDILDFIKLYDPYEPSEYAYPKEDIKDLIINNLQISIADKDGKTISPVDYEFKSYVNKKVATDFHKKELKVVSCNEDMIPVGKGNIIKLIDNHYELQLQFTRAGQTDILERLLMCTIHSNYTTKNRIISADINMTDNPIMRYVTYNNIIGANSLLINGCKLDFDNAVTRITATDFSADVMKLSSIPYDE